MARDVEQEFRVLEQEIVESRLRWAPASATSLGRHEWDGELGSRSTEAHDERARELAGQIARLDRLAGSGLPEPFHTRSGIHLKKLRFELSEESEYAAYRHQPGGPIATIGAACNGLIIRDFAPLADRLRSLASRLSQVPRFLEQARASFDTCSPVHVDTAIQQATGVEALLARDLPDVARRVDDSRVQAAVGAGQAAALGAVRGYIAWLRDVVKPNATAPVAWGRERLERLVHWQECVDWDIDTIIRRGEKDLRRHQERLREVAGRIDPGAPPQDVVWQVGREHPDASGLLPFTERTLEGLRQFCIDRELIDMPTEVRITLRETPPFQRATTLAACSPPGMYEQVATEAFYYVTPPDPSWDAERTDQYLQFFSRWALPLITAHEAYPGHYVHLMWLRRAPDSVAGTNSTTTIEGWAHYTEQLMIEVGWGDGDPRYEIMQIREALLRLCRYLAAFGLHTQGWSYADAVEFFMREGYATRPVAELESRRGVVGPSYFAYTLGKHEILDLREKVKAKWGAGYSLKRFHNAFVREPYPTAVIARTMLG